MINLKGFTLGVTIGLGLTIIFKSALAMAYPVDNSKSVSNIMIDVIKQDIQQVKKDLTTIKELIK